MRLNQKVYFDFLIIISFFFLKKYIYIYIYIYINQSRVATCRGDPQIVQGFTKKEFLFKNFKD